MRKNKSIKALLAGVVLATGVMAYSPNAEAAKPFTDLESSGSHSVAVKHLNSLDAFDYKTGTKLNGNAAVTRAEVSVILYNLHKDDLPLVRRYHNTFTDIRNNSPHLKEMMWSYEAGIFDGSAGKFNPTQSLTRAQMSKILVNTFNLKSNTTTTFKDLDSSHWAFDYVSIMGSTGVTVGDGKGNYQPNNNVTLNQLSSFIYRTMNLDESNSSSHFKTYEQAKQILIDLYNHPDFEPETVIFYTKEDIRDEYSAYWMTTDMSQVVSGYTYRGRGETYHTEKMIDGTYKHYAFIANDRTKEEEQDWYRRMDLAEKYIVDNYKLETEYDVVYALNDFVGDQIDYGKRTPESNPYLVWWEHDSACTSYTDFMATLLDRFGMESRLVGGWAWGGTHAWNAVKVGGEWYYTDATGYDADNRKNEQYLIMDEQQSPYHTHDSVFRATNKPYEMSMAKPYDYETQRNVRTMKKYN